MATARLDRIGKVYENGFRAVDGLSLDLADGEFLVLVGPSGCGKSTALRMIAGLEDISEGELFVGDRQINDLAPRDRDVAMVFQNYALYPQMTVRQNVGFPLKIRGQRPHERERQVQRAASILELMEQLGKKPGQLSGGQRQRVAMGRAIVRKPSLFLMDEPLSNLDAKLRVQMRADIAGIQKDLGVTTFYVTHDQIEAMTMGHRVAVIKDGVLQQVAPPEELYARPDNVFVAAFIGSPSMNLCEGTLYRATAGGWRIALGDQSLAVPDTVIDTRPALAARVDQPLVVGFRPEHLEDAALAPDDLLDQRLSVTVAVREALGAETLVHFPIDASPVDSGDPDALDALGGRESSRCTGRFAASTRARVGDRIEVTLDTSQLHFFDRQTHLAI